MCDTKKLIFFCLLHQQLDTRITSYVCLSLDRTIHVIYELVHNIWINAFLYCSKVIYIIGLLYRIFVVRSHGHVLLSWVAAAVIFTERSAESRHARTSQTTAAAAAAAILYYIIIMFFFLPNEYCAIIITILYTTENIDRRSSKLFIRIVY